MVVTTPTTVFILDFEITAFFFGLILCLYLRIVGGEQNERNRLFQMFCRMVTVGCAVDVTSAVSRSLTIPNPLHMFFTVAAQSCAVITTYLYMLYVMRSVTDEGAEKEEVRPPRIMLLHRLVLVLFFVIQFINLFTGISLSFNEQGHYVAGPLGFFVAFLYPLYFILAGTLYLLMNRSRYEAAQRNAVILAFSVTILLYLWQILFVRGLLMTFFVGCLDCYILYFSLETPAYQRLEELLGRLRKATAKAEEAENEAIEANRAKGKFLTSMSHEIRTPMTTILGMDEVILRRNPSGSVREHALDIEAAGDTLVHLINDILDFSKIESGEMSLETAPYHFSDLLHEVNQMIRIKAQAAQLQYESNCNEDLVDELYGDSLRVKQILLNILNNAVKYTRQGSVRLDIDGSVENEKESGLEIQRLRIKVTDTGIGIKEEDLPRLFQSYARLDLEENRSVEGTGLGLAITARLVELMNGTIRVESTYGKGSVFFLELPQRLSGTKTIRQRRETGEETKEAPSAASFTAPDAKVLIVDDNRMNRVVLKSLLKATGMHLDEAPDGEVALALSAINAYDVILMDYMMPSLNGVETLHRLRESEHAISREAIVIVCTADAITGERERLLAEGFNDYISKPVKGEELNQLLLRHLPQDKIMLQEKGDG